MEPSKKPSSKSKKTSPAKEKKSVQSSDISTPEVKKGSTKKSASSKAKPVSEASPTPKKATKPLDAHKKAKTPEAQKTISRVDSKETTSAPSIPSGSSFKLLLPKKKVTTPSPGELMSKGYKTPVEPEMGVNAPKYKRFLTALYPEAKWNIGGAFDYPKATKLFLKFISSNLENAVIAQSVHGAPPSLWSLDWYQNKPIMPPNEIMEHMEEYNKSKTPISLSFDNPTIDEDLFNDKIGNFLLNYLSKYNSTQRNSVTVASEALAQYIGKNYPKFSLRTHINKVIFEEGQGNKDYYIEEAKHFDLVAIHPKDTLNLELLASLPHKDKYEITINDSCVSGCPHRKEHILTLDKIRRYPFNADHLSYRHQILTAVKCEDINVLWTKDNRPLALLPEELGIIYNLGFRNFRIQADTLRNEITFLWDLMHYITNNNLDVSNKQGLIISSFISEFNDIIPPLNSGLKHFKFNRYD